jgi:hypothetical protein
MNVNREWSTIWVLLPVNKSVKEYGDGNCDSAKKHITKAVENYDEALELGG